jgi:hypothetical protein
MAYSTTIAKTISIEVPFEAMPKAVQEKIIAYGCQRIFNDMVGGSERFPTTEDKVAHVKAQIARFLAGDIGRQASAGVPTETAIARQLVRAALKAQLGGKSEKWAIFTGLDDAKQAEKLDALFEANKELFAPQVEAEIEARRKAAAAKSKLAGKMEIDL